MRKRGMVFGFSHVGALREAYQHRAGAGLAQCALEFIQVFPTQRFQPWVKIEDRGYAYNDKLTRDLSELVDEQRTDVVIASVWGNQHFTLGIVNHAEPFDFILPSNPDLRRVPGSRIVPYEVVRSLAQQRFELELGLIPLVQGFTDLPIFVTSAPPVIGIDSKILASTGSVELDAKIAEFGLAPAVFRYKIWRLCESVVKDYCEKNGVGFIPAPEESYDAEGYLLERYWWSDPLHANSHYGELVLRQIEAAGIGHLVEDQRRG